MADDRNRDDGEPEAGTGQASAEPEFGSSEWLLQQLSGGRLTGAEADGGTPDADVVPDAPATAADAVSSAAAETPSMVPDAPAPADDAGAPPAGPRRSSWFDLEPADAAPTASEPEATSQQPASPEPEPSFDPQSSRPDDTFELFLNPPAEPTTPVPRTPVVATPVASAPVPSAADAHDTPITEVGRPSAGDAQAVPGADAETGTSVPVESEPTVTFEPAEPFVWNLTPGVGSDPLVEDSDSNESAGLFAEHPAEPSASAGDGATGVDVFSADGEASSGPEGPAAPAVPPVTPVAPTDATPTTPFVAPGFAEALRMPEAPTRSFETPPAEATSGDAKHAADATPDAAPDATPTTQTAAPSPESKAPEQPVEPSSWNPFATSTGTTDVQPDTTENPFTPAPFPSLIEPSAPAVRPETAEPAPPVLPEAPFVLVPPVFPPAAEVPAADVPPAPPVEPAAPEPAAAEPAASEPAASEPVAAEPSYFTRPVDAIPSTPPAAIVPPVEPPESSEPTEGSEPAESSEPETQGAPTGDEAAEGHGLAALLGFFDGDDDSSEPSAPTSRSVIGDTTGIITIPAAAAAAAAAAEGAASEGAAGAAADDMAGEADTADAVNALPPAYGHPTAFGTPAPATPTSSADEIPGTDAAAVQAPVTPAPPLPPVLPPPNAGSLFEPGSDESDRPAAADTATTKLDTAEIAALLNARTGDPDPDFVSEVDAAKSESESESEIAAAAEHPVPVRPETTAQGAVPPLEDATLLMGALPSPATQPLDAESLAEASEPVAPTRSGADSILFPELATTAAVPTAAVAAAGADVTAQPTTVLPAAASATAVPAPAGPGGPGSGTGDGAGTTAGASARTNRMLFWVAGGLAVVLVLIGLFALGTRLPSLFGAAAPAPVASASTSARPTPKSTPTPTPVPTVQAKPAAAQPPGVHPWNTLGGGECVQPYTTPWADTFTVVDCTAPHLAQMVYTNLFSADLAAPYPGADALAAQINVLCTKPGVVDLNAASAYPDLQLQGTFPATDQQWKDGQRSYYCFANRSSNQPLTTSVAGPGPTG